ncbi:MAG: hypothetical protein HFF96_08870 [Oscillibacter sp.]|uniref:hypothetical protein n=1 Tax=Oscillibacter sp. TaxID=1945593 RepID=UPI0021704BB2|nr:hypothetical protein [Oscillibacter sp.]MCI9114349.1 hypothetical protein [Oscillibacter sp.]
MKQIGSLLLLLVLLLSGCGGVSKEEYDAVVRERDALLAEAELQELQAQEASPNTVTVKVTGEFTATVWELIPDYVTDYETPRMAVVTLFQSTPFTIYTGELTKHLEEGKTYVFEVEMSRYDIITRQEYESGTLLINPEVAFSMYPSLYISNFRPAEESDWGLDSVHLAYEACET